MLYPEGFEWDGAKRQENLDHGDRPDFTAAIRIFGGPHLEEVDGRQDYGEERRRAFGQLNGRCIVVVFTWRGTNRRIISARKAKPQEVVRFEQAIAAARPDRLRAPGRGHR